MDGWHLPRALDSHARILTTPERGSEMDQHAGWTRKLEAWLRQSSGRNPAAIVLGGTFNALSFARSFGRRRIPVLMLESERCLGTYTRYGKVVMLPPVGESAQRWIEALEFVGSRLDRRGVLLPTSDEHNLLVSDHRGPLEAYFRFVLPEPRTLEQIVDKQRQYRIAQEAGIPIPKTYFPQTIGEVKLLSHHIEYPCLLKPYRSHDARRHLGRKVIVAWSAPELILRYSEIDTGKLPLMVQEVVPGGDSALFGYLALWDQESRELAWVTKRKLRQFPALYGDGSLQVTVDAPGVVELSRRLLRKLDYRGFVGVEFKLDARDNSYRLMEINARAVSGNQLAINAGVDFAWIAYQYLTGSDLGVGSEKRFRSGVKYVNEEWDVQAYLALRTANAMSLRAWLGSLRGVEATAVGAWEDPMPLIVGFFRLLRKLTSRPRAAARRWFERRVGSRSTIQG
jgi:predicted ATP-grasp superfamily ATP-dependent carboligase